MQTVSCLQKNLLIPVLSMVGERKTWCGANPLREIFKICVQMQ